MMAGAGYLVIAPDHMAASNSQVRKLIRILTYTKTLDKT